MNFSSIEELKLKKRKRERKGNYSVRKYDDHDNVVSIVHIYIISKLTENQMMPYFLK